MLMCGFENWKKKLFVIVLVLFRRIRWLFNKTKFNTEVITYQEYWEIEIKKKLTQLFKQHICGAHGILSHTFERLNNLCFSTENEQILRLLLFEPIFGCWWLLLLCIYQFTAKCKPLPRFDFFSSSKFFCFERVFLFYCMIWTKNAVEYFSNAICTGVRVQAKSIEINHD